MHPTPWWFIKIQHTCPLDELNSNGYSPPFTARHSSGDSVPDNGVGSMVQPQYLHDHVHLLVWCRCVRLRFFFFFFFFFFVFSSLVSLPDQAKCQRPAFYIHKRTWASLWLSGVLFFFFFFFVEHITIRERRKNTGPKMKERDMIHVRMWMPVSFFPMNEVRWWNLFLLGDAPLYVIFPVAFPSRSLFPRMRKRSSFPDPGEPRTRVTSPGLK